MANSYLGGHSLHRRSWFGRGKQIQESPLQDTEVYDDVELLSRLKAAHVYRRETPVRSPVQKISAQSDEVAIIEFLWEFAHVKADIAEAVTAE